MSATGNFPGRISIPINYLDSHACRHTFELNMKLYYHYIDLIYKKLFIERINEYTGQPYVTNPRISPDNKYDWDEIIQDQKLEFIILFDIPVNDRQITFRTVPLVIQHNIDRPYCDSYTEKVKVLLALREYKGRDQIGNPMYSPDTMNVWFRPCVEDVYSDYISLYFMVWIYIYHDFYMFADTKGAMLNNLLKVQAFLRFIRTKPIEELELDKTRMITFMMPSNHPMSSLFPEIQREDIARLIYAKLTNFKETMKRLSGHF
jgi:hypothetical protein